MDELQAFLASEEQRVIELADRADELERHLMRLRAYARRRGDSPPLREAIEATSVEIELTRELREHVQRRLDALRRVSFD